MFFNHCECSHVCELNIESNSIDKKFIRICVKHADKMFSGQSNKDQYKFSKKKNVYYLRSRPAKLRLKESSSTEVDSVVDFGKYTGESYQEVYKKDKTYCAHIMRIASQKNLLPRGMFNFSDFIKKSMETVR